MQLSTEGLSELQIMRFSSLGARIKPYIPGPVGSLGIFSLCLVGTRTPLWYSSPNSNCFGLPGLLVLTPQLRKSAQFFLDYSVCTIDWQLFLGSKLRQSQCLTLFISLPLWSTVLHSCLFNIFCLFCFCSRVSRRVNLVLVALPWLARLHLDYYKLLLFC